MCGIYGFIGNSKDLDRTYEVIERLAVLTEERGAHATGYYAVGDEVIFDKLPIRASQFIKTSNFNRVKEMKSIQYFIGHNRWATNGDPADNRNNHPFTTGRFGFVHNGVVHREVNIRMKSECDSERIFRYFLKVFYDDHNHFRSIEKTMQYFENDNFACVLGDAKEKKIYLFRNSGRPLVWYFDSVLNVIFFASTEKILRSALMDVGIVVKKIIELREEHILRIDEKLKMTTYKLEVKKDISSSYVPFIKFNFKEYLKDSKDDRCTCKICRSMFISKEYLKHHLESIHDVSFNFEAYTL